MIGLVAGYVTCMPACVLHITSESPTATRISIHTGFTADWVVSQRRVHLKVSLGLIRHQHQLTLIPFLCDGEISRTPSEYLLRAALTNHKLRYGLLSLPPHGGLIVQRANDIDSSEAKQCFLADLLELLCFF
jgi:hypothetical protein